MVWCNETGEKYDASEEQYSLLPRALADADGNPHKGNKCTWTASLQNRYNLPITNPYITVLPWTPEIAILDAMFAININPLRQHKSVTEYANFIFRQFVLRHYQRGTNEVHLVFDNPERHSFNPKYCEHKGMGKMTNVMFMLCSHQNHKFPGHGESILIVNNVRDHLYKLWV